MVEDGARIGGELGWEIGLGTVLGTVEADGPVLPTPT